MKKKCLLILCLCAVVFVISGCRTAPEKIVKRYDRPLGAGEQALRKITNPLEIPDFSLACLDLAGLREAVSNSLNYMSKPSSQTFFPSNGISHQLAVDSLNEFAALLDSGLGANALSAAIIARFDVYTSVGCDDEGTVLFTGYYTPIFDGSETMTEQFKFPLYKKPDDLVKGYDGEILGRRGIDGGVTPYPSRAVIEDAMLLRGQELVWLEDEFEAYIAHVQGSAKIQMPDGNLQGVGYSGNNGHEYSSISKLMLQDGSIGTDQLSLSAMIAYFKRNPGQVKRYVRRNNRYVFFMNEDGPPRGSLNEPVTPMRSIATDKSIFPRGSVVFISTVLPQRVGDGVAPRIYRGFAMDQDTGGAIRAPGRCDVYMGIGDEAGERAGQTYQEGRMYYLFLKE